MALLSQIFETLVRTDEIGQIQPWLATGWTHEPDRKRWVFTARTGVMLHNGSVWPPPDGVVSVPDKKPLGEILRDLSKPVNAIVVRGPDGTLAGTGPFRIAHWQSGKMARLEADEAYWQGRPYLDAVELRTVAGSRERLLDLELAKTDVAEAEVTDVRPLRQKGVAVQVSKPMDRLALVFENPQIPAATRQAVALAIDRPSIQRVLLDRQGDISGALLPQWLSGYAFLFTTERDLGRAKTLARGSVPLALDFDREDPLIRSIAERIAVNASEAGLTLRAGRGACDVRLRRLPLVSSEARQALEAYAAMLGVSLPQTTSPYEAELAVLKAFRVIPLFHLPLVYALRGNVRNWTTISRLDGVWLESGTKP
jgi:MarR-like DNA-binding transcriptional regulator SgrR of sgrS sRNA